MQFFDIARVKCTSWSGGDGAVAARREKYIPYGWPAGGNGGRGWSIIVRADSQLTTLQYLHGRKHIKAPAGEPGRTKEQYGKDAEDLIIEVPVGTTVRELTSGKVVCSLDHHGQQVILLAGGRGGTWNMHFKSSVNQYSNFALLGEPWQSAEFEFELQLIADVALLGAPSVGKTSLLNAVSAAAAKTADYPFTTLVPNLGVVTEADPPFVLVDVPGLIEWAAAGKGLGNEFLRHIMKARIRCLVTDLSWYEQSIEQLVQLLEEIEQYMSSVVFPEYELTQQLIVESKTLIRRVEGKPPLTPPSQPRNTAGSPPDKGELEGVYWTPLLQKKFLFVINKIDLVTDQEVQQEFVQVMIEKLLALPIVKATKKQLSAYIFLVSAGSREGLSRLIKQCTQLLTVAAAVREEASVLPLSQPSRKPKNTLAVKDITQESWPWLVEHEYLDEKELKYVYIREVTEPELQQLVYILPWWNDEAELRFRKTLDKKWILKDLLRAGVKKGDVFFIRSPYATREDRRIRRE